MMVTMRVVVAKMVQVTMGRLGEQLSDAVLILLNICLLLHDLFCLDALELGFPGLLRHDLFCLDALELGFRGLLLDALEVVLDCLSLLPLSLLPSRWCPGACCPGACCP